MLKLIEIVVNQGVSLLDILKLVGYILPDSLIFTIPMAVLFAVLLAFGRLSADREIVALKSAGISLFQMTPPVFILAVFAYLLTTFLSLYVLPWGNHSLKNHLFKITQKKANIGIKERIFNDDFEGIVLYVNKITSPGGRMEGVMVSDQREMEEPSTIIAREGLIFSNLKSLTITLRLIDGILCRVSKDFKGFQKMNFETYDLNLCLKTKLKKSSKKDREMWLRELRSMIKRLKEAGLNFTPPLITLYKKFSIPFACLVFGLIGAPLGVQTGPSERFRGFMLGLGAVLIYYIFLIFGEALSESKKISPSIGMWLPNFIFLISGVYLLIMANRERPIKALVWLNRKISKAGSYFKAIFEKV
jgi:lipopolysaccharide export system permease protein